MKIDFVHIYIYIYTYNNKFIFLCPFIAEQANKFAWRKVVRNLKHMKSKTKYQKWMKTRPRLKALDM